MMMNDIQLRRWLAREVWAETIQVARRTPKPPKGPPRNMRYRAWIRTLPCLGCGVEGRSEAAHTGKDGGMRQRSSDFSCVPLCPNCHTFGNRAYHRIGRESFERYHGLKFAMIVKRLNRIWRECAGLVK